MLSINQSSSRSTTCQLALQREHPPSHIVTTPDERRGPLEQRTRQYWIHPRAPFGLREQDLAFEIATASERQSLFEQLRRRPFQTSFREQEPAAKHSCRAVFPSEQALCDPGRRQRRSVQSAIVRLAAARVAY